MIRRLIDELGVNLAGADIILRLRERIAELEAEREQLQQEIQRLRDQQLPAVQPARLHRSQSHERSRRS